MIVAIDARQDGPSTPLAVDEIRGMINRLRRAHIAASVNDDPRWHVISLAINSLQNLHRLETGTQY